MVLQNDVCTAEATFDKQESATEEGMVIMPVHRIFPTAHGIGR